MSASNIKFFILALLVRQPMSGYDIRLIFKKLNWLVGSPSYGSLYPALHQLLKDQLVTVETQNQINKPTRKIYTITPKGKGVSKEWLNEPFTAESPLKTFIMRLLLADNHSREHLIGHLEQRREQVAAHHAMLSEMIAAPDTQDNLERRMAPEYGLALADAEIAWLDDTLARLTAQS